MKPQKCCLLTVLALSSLAGSPAKAAVIINGGFEAPVTTDGAPFIGFWEAFTGGAGATSANSTLSPRTGTQSLMLSITAVDNTFAGVFQDIPGIIGGQSTTVSGFHRTSSAPLGLGTELRIEWRNSVTNTEVGRTPNSTPVPGAAYGPFSLTATVPAGADIARVVYAIQTFGPEPGNTGTVFVDDMSIVVPEATSAILLGLGGLGLAGRRRQR